MCSQLAPSVCSKCKKLDRFKMLSPFTGMLSIVPVTCTVWKSVTTYFAWSKLISIEVDFSLLR